MTEQIFSKEELKILEIIKQLRMLDQQVKTLDMRLNALQEQRGLLVQERNEVLSLLNQQDLILKDILSGKPLENDDDKNKDDKKDKKK